MAGIPDYQAAMLPLLKLAADGREHSIREAVEQLAQQFQLSDDERRDPLPVSAQPRFDNRVGWARTYLTKAGLLDRPGRGTFRLTDAGRELLGEGLSQLTSKDLERYPQFRAFKTRAQDLDEAIAEKSTETPEEIVEAAYADMRSALAQELLDSVKRATPSFLEQLVIDLLLAMGYGNSRLDAGQAIGQSGDGGIDGIVKQDKLGIDRIYVQAKRWENPVGSRDVQGFVGSLAGHHARKGVFITTSRFTKDAKDYSERPEQNVVLIDGEELANLMIEYDIGVRQVKTYTVKRVDSDYFIGGDTTNYLLG